MALPSFGELVVGEIISSGLPLLEGCGRLRRVWQQASHLLMEEEGGAG